MRQHERDDVLLDAVFVDLEVPFAEVRDELPAIVSNDDVAGNQVCTPPDDIALRWRRGRHERAGFRRLRRRLLRGLRAGRRAEPEQPDRDQHHGPPQLCTHTLDYTGLPGILTRAGDAGDADGRRPI